MENIEMSDVKVRFDYVKTYPDWKLKICKLIRVIPSNRFSVYLTFVVKKDSNIGAGCFVRFDNYLQANIIYHEDQGDLRKLSCFLFSDIPVREFPYCFKYFNVLGKPYSEK